MGSAVFCPYCSVTISNELSVSLACDRPDCFSSLFFQSSSSKVNQCFRAFGSLESKSVTYVRKEKWQCCLEVSSICRQSTQTLLQLGCINDELSSFSHVMKPRLTVSRSSLLLISLLCGSLSVNLLESSR
jgi:hypothetical protein